MLLPSIVLNIPSEHHANHSPWQAKKSYPYSQPCK